MFWRSAARLFLRVKSGIDCMRRGDLITLLFVWVLVPAPLGRFIGGATVAALSAHHQSVRSGPSVVRCSRQLFSSRRNFKPFRSHLGL